jgi:hypothetical protein
LIPDSARTLQATNVGTMAVRQRPCREVLKPAARFMARRKRGKSMAAKLLQFLLLVALVAAGVRLYFILRERTRPAAPKPKAAVRPLNREAYVVPRKLHAYDLASARELTKQPVWVQEGYRYTYYPYDSARRRADFVREAGLLGPIE